MKYTKQQNEFYLNTITELRGTKYTWEQIGVEFKERFGIKDITWLRKKWELLNKHLDLEIELDENTINHRIAKKMAILRTEQKILTKERNILNRDANVIAFRNLILKHLSDFKWNRYIDTTKAVKMPKKCLKMLNKAVYIVGDEHYKGKCDEKHLNYIYDSIALDIKANKYNSVEIWFLGDGIDGLIHLGQLSTNDGIIQPALEYANICIERINKIPQINSVKFVNESNHTQIRPVGTSRNELAKQDMGYVVAELFKYGLRKDIEFQSEDIMRFNYDGFGVAMLHGHQDFAKNKNRLIEYWSAKYHEVPDLILMGHYHQFKISEYGINKWLVVCPTAKNFNGDYENVNGYISYSQITKMTLKDGIPNFQIMSVKEEK